MEFSSSQTENFEMEKLSSDTGYFKKPVEINRGQDDVRLCTTKIFSFPCFKIRNKDFACCDLTKNFAADF